MVKNIYTEEQRSILLANKNVAKVGKGTLAYTEEFKIRAVKQYNQEYLSQQKIFKKAGFDIEMIGKKKPIDCLKRWNKVYKQKGEEGLLDRSEGRGRPKKHTDKTDKDRIKRLELEIKYLKAENSFLAKLRAKRKRD